MLDLLVFVSLVLTAVFIAIAEHKQELQRLEFEEKVAWMRWQLKKYGTDNDKGDFNE